MLYTWYTGNNRYTYLHEFLLVEAEGGRTTGQWQALCLPHLLSFFCYQYVLFLNLLKEKQNCSLFTLFNRKLLVAEIVRLRSPLSPFAKFISDTSWVGLELEEDGRR